MNLPFPTLTEQKEETYFFFFASTKNVCVSEGIVCFVRSFKTM